MLSCAVPEAFKPKKVDPNIPVNADERARKNIEEGRGISLKGAMKGKSTTYEFSTSNPLWRASLETIDFMPLSTVDYSGGIIITDWYSETGNNNGQLRLHYVFYQMKFNQIVLRLLFITKIVARQITVL